MSIVIGGKELFRVSKESPWKDIHIVTKEEWDALGLSPDQYTNMELPELGLASSHIQNQSMNKSLEDKITEVELKLLDISIKLSEAVRLVAELRGGSSPVAMTEDEIRQGAARLLSEVDDPAERAAKLAMREARKTGGLFGEDLGPVPEAGEDTGRGGVN